MPPVPKRPVVASRYPTHLLSPWLADARGKQFDLAPGPVVDPLPFSGPLALGCVTAAGGSLHLQNCSPHLPPQQEPLICRPSPIEACHELHVQLSLFPMRYSIVTQRLSAAAVCRHGQCFIVTLSGRSWCPFKYGIFMGFLWGISQIGWGHSFPSRGHVSNFIWKLNNKIRCKSQGTAAQAVLLGGGVRPLMPAQN